MKTFIDIHISTHLGCGVLTLDDDDDGVEDEC